LHRKRPWRLVVKRPCNNIWPPLGHRIAIVHPVGMPLLEPGTWRRSISTCNWNTRKLPTFRPKCDTNCWACPFRGALSKSTVIDATAVPFWTCSSRPFSFLPPASCCCGSFRCAVAFWSLRPSRTNCESESRSVVALPPYRAVARPRRLCTLARTRAEPCRTDSHSPSNGGSDSPRETSATRFELL
jgi:hypothetical protein